MRFEEKVAIIQLAREGAKVTRADLNDQHGQTTEREIRDKGHEALFIHCYVGNLQPVAAALALESKHLSLCP